jgi:hypothetical protein
MIPFTNQPLWQDPALFWAQQLLLGPTHFTQTSIAKIKGTNIKQPIRRFFKDNLPTSLLKQSGNGPFL